ncbi:MAG: UDP-3-O-[3-hydroxymyristoyl] N-acetylglucosamine deacetylase [Nitrospinae bacterium]|nr:UDP-3-O-[3-hydroxymyristoyl] N-acetylglucosamine deacetylase [Nitrospinota bacterium]
MKKKKAHILIVDDEESILTSIEGILSDEGFKVSKAMDGFKALEVIQSDQPDLVLLDIWIPGMDGIEILKAIKGFTSDLNVIVMSGHGSIDTAVMATKLGAFDFIEKPLSLENIIFTINHALDKQKIGEGEIEGLPNEDNIIAGIQRAEMKKDDLLVTDHFTHQKIGFQERVVNGTRSSGCTRQRTLKRSVVLCGQGLHSGLKTGLILSPLPPNSGIIFGDISTGEVVPAHLDHVESTEYATSLKRGYTTVRTIEHIMAVLHMYKISNLFIKIGDEVPIMDGSAKDFCKLIEDGGIEEQEAINKELEINRYYYVKGALDDKRTISIEPWPNLTIHYTMEYPPPVGRQEYSYKFLGKEGFKDEIAPARTFGFLKDFEKLEEKGLASGGKLSNVILLDNGRVINTTLRFSDEFVRHKILDIIGDFYLLGRPIKGLIKANMTGHAENILLLKKMREG